MERPQASAELEIAFWLLYSAAILACAAFFAWNLLHYFVHKKAQPQQTPPPRPRSRDSLVPEVVALEAQFMLAPKLALAEAKRLLDDRHVVLPAEVIAGDTIAQFERLLDAVAQTRRSRELREV